MKQFVLGITLAAILHSFGMTAMAQTPAITGLSISASSPSNLTNDDLLSSYTVNGTVVETAESWYLNGAPITTLYLPFEGGSTDALQDFSGLNHDAVYSSSSSQRPAWAQDLGYNGHGVFVFDGGDYLEVADGLPVDADYTKTAWIHATGAGTTFRNILSANFYGENNHVLKMDPDGILNAGHAFGSRVVASPDSLYQDVWYFVAVSFEYASGEMVLYLDGVEIDKGTVPSEYRSVDNPTVRIGSMGSNSYFEGRIDEPRIYSRVLSGPQINSLFNDGNGILKGNETNGSDIWHVEVTPFSIDDVGSTMASNSIEILGPEISGFSLEASSPSNLTNDDLQAIYTSNGAVVETAEAWHVDGMPLNSVYLPFEGGFQNAILDFSGNNNDAVYDLDASHRPTWSQDLGYNGNGAFLFDGDDYLEIEDALPLNADYTKTAWVYATGTGFRNILSADFYGENNHVLKIDPDGTLNAGHAFGSRVVWSPDPLNQNQWYFVAVSFYYESGEMYLYLDGEEVHRSVVPEEYRSVADPTVRVGSMGSNSYFQGRIDEPRIFNRALSAPQINSLYNDGNSILQSSETRGSESWHVELTPFSINEVGSTSVSNSIDILGPELSALSLDASSPGDLTVDNLSASYSENASVVETTVAWYKNGIPDALLYLPMEGGPLNANLDFSGNNNHAILPPNLSSGIPDWIPNYGIDGSGCYYFDSYLDHLVAGDVLPLNNDYTKSAWIYINGSNTTYRNIISADFVGPNNHYLNVANTGRLGAGQNTGIRHVEDPAQLIVHEWYFVAVTFDYESGEMVLYKNGSEVDRAILPPEDRSVADPTVLIGAMASGSNWHGRIDEPRVYGRVLTPEQIEEMFTNRKDGLVAEETRGSDEWHVEVTPFADYEVGATSISNALTVNSTIVSDISDQTILEGASFNTIDLDDNVVDYEYGDNELTWTTHGESELSVLINSSNIVTISIPSSTWFGSENIYFVARNPFGDADSTEVTFTVQSVNDPPVITELGDQSVDEDNSLIGLTVTFDDIDDSDTHIITVESDEINVSVENLSGHTTGSTYDLVPVADWYGSAQITVTVTDNGSGNRSDVEIYTLTVNPINDVPVLTAVGNQTTIEDNPVVGLSVIFADPDPTDVHSISVVSLEPNVSVQNLSGNTSGSTYDLVPAPNWTGTAQITVTVTENGVGGLSDTEIYALEVNAINDAPVLTEIGPQSVDEDNSLTGLTVVFSDQDVTDDHTITVISNETSVTVANLIGNTSGSTYDLVPDANWNGSAQITVTITDDGPGTLSDTEVYTFTVNSVNDAPAAINLSNNAVDEGVSVGTVVGLLSSTDFDPADTHSYQFMFEGGDEEIDNHFFQIIGDEVRVAVELDYELKNSFALLIQSDDGNGGTLTQQIPMTVNNIVETGIGDENENLSFKVYPVPAVDRITVEVDNPRNAELQLEIYSNSGVLVHSEHTVHGNTIDLSEFSKGMYILRIHGEDISKTRKIIVGDR